MEGRILATDTLVQLAGAAVVASGIFLVMLGVGAVLARRRTERFLRGFASSARTHYLEQSLRLVAGLGFVWYAPRMRFPGLFGIFGWFLVISALALLLIPWRWHHRFGRRVIPMAVAYLPLIALGALSLGGFVLFAALL